MNIRQPIIGLKESLVTQSKNHKFLLKMSAKYQVKFQIDQAQDNSRKFLMGSDATSAQSQGSKVKIHVTNLETLDEFEGNHAINTDYLPKLQSWINKKKYQCLEQYPTADDDLLLQLQVDIFKFMLKKIEKSDMEKIKEEMEALKQERLMIDREMKLFNYHFFTMVGRDHTQHKGQIFPNVNQGFNLGHTTIFSVEQLYHQFQGQGVIEARDGSGAPHADVNPAANMLGDPNSPNLEPSAFSDELSRSLNNPPVAGIPVQSSRPMYLLEVKQPIPQNMQVNSKSQEVILYGHGCKTHIVAKISRTYVRKTVYVDETNYYYQINVSVKNG